MPEPAPEGIEPGDNWPRNIYAFVHFCGNRRHRLDRAKRILARAMAGEWCCWTCRTPIPFTRRADAKYCREACRKAAARWRRKHKAQG